jgi:uncharacterized OsmC-like protein
MSNWTAETLYLGQLRTQATHLYSKSILETDAPLDNHGLAERFSPTDLVATALGSCMITVLGIVSNREQWAIEGTKVMIQKNMDSDPRRISGIDIEITFPIGDYDERKRTILENTARTCPVAKSLHPDLIQNVTFIYPV